MPWARKSSRLPPPPSSIFTLLSKLLLVFFRSLGVSKSQLRTVTWSLKVSTGYRAVGQYWQSLTAIPNSLTDIVQRKKRLWKKILTVQLKNSSPGYQLYILCKHYQHCADFCCWSPTPSRILILLISKKKEKKKRREKDGKKEKEEQNPN